MEFEDRDIELTKRALELAAKGVGLVSPNPLVGCVIVDKNGEVAGEGTYTFDNLIHAEAIALAAAGERARGGTAYVSLEPHSHQGRTGPCTEALIKAGIRRVVCPIDDPNPLVSGRGFEQLRRQGVEVVTGILANEAKEQNEKFICWHDKQRPFVHLKLAISLDGRIAAGKSVSTALSGEAARRYVQELRHSHDAILIGSGTAVIDDPKLTDRSEKPRRRPLLRVILDGRGRISPKLQVAHTDAAPTIVYTASDLPEADKLGSQGVSVAAIDPRDLRSVLADLKEREVQSVLVEGGSEVAGSFVDARLVDKVTFVISPLIIGGSAPMAVAGRGITDIADAMRLAEVTVKPLGNDVILTGYPEAR